MAGAVIGGAMMGSMVNVSMPVNYHGQAEKEIKSGKYDPKLWAEALVLVEGDETRRYAKYIDLRAAQLEHEAQAPVWRQRIRDHLAILPKRHICYF
jgi:hypothetical protein